MIIIENMNNYHELKKRTAHKMITVIPCGFLSF